MEDTPSKHETWLLIRQAIVFQLKLGLDALRDILLSPISIVLIVVDILLVNNQQQSYFIRLMRVGRQSDQWINLFGVDSPHEEPDDSNVSTQGKVDDWFKKIEEVIKEQQVEGKLSQSGKEKLQQYFAQLNFPSDKPKNKS